MRTKTMLSGHKVREEQTFSDKGAGPAQARDGPEVASSYMPFGRELHVFHTLKILLGFIGNEHCPVAGSQSWLSTPTVLQ